MKCDVCKKDFRPNTKAQKRCSKECVKEHKRLEYIRKGKKLASCEICSKEFARIYSREKTCSKSCSAKLREKNKKPGVYIPLPLDTRSPEIRMKNMFLLRGAA